MKLLPYIFAFFRNFFHCQFATFFPNFFTHILFRHVLFSKEIRFATPLCSEKYLPLVRLVMCEEGRPRRGEGRAVEESRNPSSWASSLLGGWVIVLGIGTLHLEDLVTMPTTKAIGNDVGLRSSLLQLLHRGAVEKKLSRFYSLLLRVLFSHDVWRHWNLQQLSADRGPLISYH